MCRCAERRVVLSEAASAAARGDLAPAMPAIKSVVVTSAQDVVAAARRLAHVRLRR